MNTTIITKKWTIVDLPWETSAHPPALPQPDTHLQEYVLFDGLTFREALDQINLRCQKAWREAGLNSSSHKGPMPLELDQRLAECRAEAEALGVRWKAIPEIAAWQAAREEADAAYKASSFCNLLSPGMVFETVDGARYLVGHVDSTGDTGSEYNFLEPSTIIHRYCMVLLEEQLANIRVQNCDVDPWERLYDINVAVGCGDSPVIDAIHTMHSEFARVQEELSSALNKLEELKELSSALNKLEELKELSSALNKLEGLKELSSALNLIAEKR